MPSANINGRDIFYQDTGGAGPVIIFSHGLMMDHLMFAPQVEALRGTWRCIAWDERGHGQTATDSLEPFSYYDSADDLAGPTSKRPGRRARRPGRHVPRAAASCRCAAPWTRPQIVRALILIDTQAGCEDPATLPVNMELTRQWAEHGLSTEIADMVEQHHSRRELVRRGGLAGEKWGRMKPVNLTQCMQTLGSRDDITDKIAAIKAPTLVIHGDADARPSRWSAPRSGRQNRRRQAGGDPRRRPRRQPHPPRPRQRRHRDVPGPSKGAMRRCRSC